MLYTWYNNCSPVPTIRWLWNVNRLQSTIVSYINCRHPKLCIYVVYSEHKSIMQNTYVSSSSSLLPEMSPHPCISAADKLKLQVIRVCQVTVLTFHHHHQSHHYNYHQPLLHVYNGALIRRWDRSSHRNPWYNWRKPDTKIEKCTRFYRWKRHLSFTVTLTYR